MPDKENVIKGMELLYDRLLDAAKRDAIAMLDASMVANAIVLMKEQEPNKNKYEYKYDHTDCIWYHGGKGRCPSTCSQYRDGWNDAMNYIFKNGVGYRPYKRR